MELTMEAQKDATPWPETSDELPLNGRGHFSKLGVVRRKPSRADAPLTLSKSCTDKLAMKQCTSLLSSLTSLLVHPRSAYLHQLVVPQDQFVPSALRRSFSPTGRMAPLLSKLTSGHEWKDGYRLQPFALATTSTKFQYSRKETAAHGRTIGSNLTAMWTPNKEEVIIGGIIQGHKQFESRGASSISRAKSWTLATKVATAVSSEAALSALKQATYSNVKNSALLKSRRNVKVDVKNHALRGWVPNMNDDSFALDEEVLRAKD